LQLPAQRAVDALLRAQVRTSASDVRSGWSPCAGPGNQVLDSKAGLEATITAVQALSSARAAGLTVDARALAGVEQFADDVWAEVANAPGDDPRVVPLAMLRLLLRPAPADPVVQRAVDQILRSLDAPHRARDARALAEECFVMTQVHGPASTTRDPLVWTRWADARRAAILRSQDASAGSCHHGGWLQQVAKPVPDPLVTTAWTTLALESTLGFESVLHAPK
jgi:hypothetical protein